MIFARPNPRLCSRIIGDFLVESLPRTASCALSHHRTVRCVVPSKLTSFAASSFRVTLKSDFSTFGSVTTGKPVAGSPPSLSTSFHRHHFSDNSRSIADRISNESSHDSPNFPLPKSPVGPKSDSIETQTPSSDLEETLFSKEFAKLDDLKSSLDGRKSVDASGRSLPRRRVKPKLQPSFNFASYVNDSPLLTELIRLGVDLTRWEKVTP